MVSLLKSYIVIFQLLLIPLIIIFARAGRRLFHIPTARAWNCTWRNHTSVLVLSLPCGREGRQWNCNYILNITFQTSFHSVNKKSFANEALCWYIISRFQLTSHVNFPRPRRSWLPAFSRCSGPIAIPLSWSADPCQKVHLYSPFFSSWNVFLF